jgi:hypothetical protein
MKKMKRFFAMVTLVAMVFTMLTTAYAEDAGSGSGSDNTTKYTITIKDTVSGHKYQAYQIFKGNVSGTTLSDIDWGNGIDSEKQSKITDYVNKAINATITDESKKVNYTTAAEVASYLTEKYSSSGLPSDFTKLLGECLSDNVAGTSNENTTTSKDNVVTTNNYTITDLTGGYYLIKQTNGSIASTDDDSYTKYIVAVAGNTEVEPKVNTPSVEKKVLDDDANTDNDWQDSADYDIGDLVPFKLTATVASNYSAYSSYSLILHDSAEHFTFTLKDANFKVTVKTGATENDVSTDFNDALSTYVSIPDSKAEGYDGCLFEINFSDLKKDSIFKELIKDGSQIVIEYNAKLSDDAVIGSTGNPNYVQMTYSNNPYVTDSHGTTPKDQVVVFTYELDVTKVNEKEVALPGAGFTLYKKGAGANGADLQIGSELYYYESTEEGVKKDANLFTWKGLDAGTYIISETHTPAGYNTINDIEFTITAEHSDTWTSGSSADVLTKFEVNNTKITVGKNGYLSATIKNQSGNTLPSAGGMGTKLLYLIGALLVLFAGTMLVAKKRTGSDR